MLACPFSYQPSTLHSQAICTLMPRALPLLRLWNYYVWQWYNRGWLQSVVFCSLMQTAPKTFWFVGDAFYLLHHKHWTQKLRWQMNEWWGLDMSLKDFFFNLHELQFFTWLSMPMDGVLCSLPSSQLCFQTPRRSDNEPACMCALTGI